MKLRDLNKTPISLTVHSRDENDPLQHFDAVGVVQNVEASPAVWVGSACFHWETEVTEVEDRPGHYRTEPLI